MHIVYIIAPGGGPEAYVKTLLPWLEAKGHRVSVIYTVANVGREHSFPSTVSVRYAPSGSLHYYVGKLIGGFRAWPKRIRNAERAQAVNEALRELEGENPIDVIEVCEGLPIKQLRKSWPIIVRAHGSDWSFRHFCNDQPSEWDRLLIQDQSRQLFHADALSPISQHLMEHLSEFCNFPLQQMQHVPYPIDNSFFSPGSVDKKPQPEPGPILLCIGRLEHRKGTDVLIRAACRLWPHFPNMKIYFLGKESQFSREELLCMIPDSKHSHVIFPGFIPHAQLPSYYRAATVYVAPTQYETFGYTILEAMACGKPVISCPVGAVPELVVDGENGRLVPFNDDVALAKAIEELCTDPTLAKQMGEVGRLKAVDYAIEKIGNQLLGVYQSAIDSYWKRRGRLQ